MDAKELKDIIDNHKMWLDSSNNTGEKADLRRADLSGFDLRGADLSGADLRRTNLRGADLRWANLSEADLIGADLIGANLIGANLIGTDLSEANINGASLRGTNLIVLHFPFYTAYIQRDNTRIGCKYLSNKEWVSLSDEEIEKMDSNALESWTAYKSIIFAAMDTLTMTMESK